MQIRSVQAEVKSLETEDPNGAFKVILSDASTDRDEEIIDAGAFDPLPDHITFDTDHGLSIATTVGSGKPTYVDDQLIVCGTYSSIPRAQEIRTLVKEGHIRTTSVAFMGAKKETKDGKSHITKAELLNGSFVPIPSNRNALVLASKAAKAGARNSATDSGRLQQIHDLSVENGAACDTTAKSVGRKAVVGSYEERKDDITDAIVDANSDALAALYPDVGPGEYEWYVQIIATFADRVVYQLGYGDDNQYQVSYQVDTNGDVTLGTPEPVEVDQVISPADAQDTQKSAPDPQDATGAGGQDDEQHLELRARAIQLLAASA